MSDEPAAASFLDRVNTLSAPAVAGLGAAAGVLFAVLSALSVEPNSAADVAHAAAVGAESKTAVAAGADEDAPAGASQAGGDAAAEQPAEAAGDEHDSASPHTGEHDAEAEADEDAAAAEAADADGDPEDEPQDVVLLDPDVGTSDDAEPDPADDPAADDPAAAAAPGEAPAGSPAGRTQSDRDAEAKMDADELLTAAEEAYKDKRYKDAYRLATRSQRARPKDKAQMLRGRSACRLRDEKNAREIVRSFKLGDEHRKTLRTFCKDRGVRVGL